MSKFTDNFYDQKYLNSTISMVKDNIRDLSVWSVYNDDKYTVTIGHLRDYIHALESLIKDDAECKHENTINLDDESGAVACTDCQKQLK